MASLSRKSSAFTMFELILVMLVLSIIVGLVVPSFNSFAIGRQVSDTADELVAMARFAHSQAIADGAPYCLNIDAKARTFWVSALDSGGTDHVISTSYGQVVQIPDGTAIQTDVAAKEDRTTIHFYPDGRTEPGTITLTSGRKTIALTCKSAAENYVLAGPQQEAK